MKKVTEKSFSSLDSCVDESTLMWKSGEEKTLVETKIFNLNQVHRTSTDGREGDFVEIESPDWVNIVPVFKGTDGEEYFVMERQFRHGSRSVVLEFPAGLVEKGEDPLKAAARELEEETGIRAHKIREVGQVNTNPAFMTNTAHFFIAEELEELGTRHFDANEQIDVVNVKVSDILNNDIGGQELNNGIVLLAVFYFLKERRKI